MVWWTWLRVGEGDVGLRMEREVEMFGGVAVIRTRWVLNDKSALHVRSRLFLMLAQMCLPTFESRYSTSMGFGGAESLMHLRSLHEILRHRIRFI